MRKLAIILISISLLSCEQLSMNDNNNLESIYPMTKKVNTSDLYFSKEIQDPYSKRRRLVGLVYCRVGSSENQYVLKQRSYS